jgi:hypothetical protein
LAVPFKRARSRPVEYLELFAEIQAVLAAIDRSTTNGRRDYALLASMFNTGARVQEIVALRISDLRLESPPHLRLFGKGRKERICPLWSQTADLLRALLAERGTNQPRADQSLFVNHHGEPLTRFGVRYILAKYCTQAREAMPTLATKRLHPHSMRHSTAVHLLRSGVDMVTISQRLGHANVTTTNRYATVDLEMKRKAIEQARPIDETAAGNTATVLLVCLREELARFDAASGDSTRLVLTRQQLRELVHQFRRETNDQTRDVRAVDAAIRQLEELSFLRPFGPVEAETFEVMRILKARFGASELQEVKDRLARHVETGA